MPSMMVHLLAAYKLDSKRTPLFYIGTLAPDCIKTREEKDFKHLRTSKNPLADLEKMAETVEKNDFNLGMIFHLYVDYYWDNEAIKSYIKIHEDWFLPYRKEIGILSSLMYHHYEWSKHVWEKMLTIRIEDYPETDLPKEEIFDLINRNKSWHEEERGKPDFYTLEYVEDFTDRVVSSFRKWIEL